MVALSGAALCRGQPRDTKEAERWRYKSKLVCSASYFTNTANNRMPRLNDIALRST